MKGKRKQLHIGSIKGTRAGDDDDLEIIHNEDWKDAIDVGELRVFEGDLALDGDFDASNGALLVKGNLTVTHVLSLDETGSLIVTGNVRCRNLGCEGNLEIQGDATVEEAIFGYYEAGITFFEGKIRAKLFLEGNHAFEYEKKQLEVGTHLRFDNFQPASKTTKTQAEKVLSPEALDALGPLLGISETEPTIERGELFHSKGFLLDPVR